LTDATSIFTFALPEWTINVKVENEIMRKLEQKGRNWKGKGPSIIIYIAQVLN
jgi:hypothetical protein